jgi:hypothetical protein
LDGLLERHTVLCGQGETFNGKVMEWKIASTKKEQIENWMEAFTSVKFSLYYQPLYGESEMLSSLAQRMMNSISITDRWYYFKVYSSCFIGSDAVTWLQNDLNCLISEAIYIGNKMLNLNFFYHVVREYFFCNSYYFYRFNKVMRSVKQIKKKRFSSSSSSRGSVSYFESVTTGSKSSSQLDGIMSPVVGGGGGRLSEHYCFCDLYPRQSEILSQSTENLTLLVDEINSMYSSQSLGSQESQGEGARGEEEGGEVSDLKVDQEDDTISIQWKIVHLEIKLSLN